MEVQPEPLLTLLKDDIHQTENTHCQAYWVSQIYRKSVNNLYLADAAQICGKFWDTQ